MMIEKRRGLLAGACVAALLAVAGAGVAQEQTGDGSAEGSAFSLRGFGTVGLARSSSGQAELARDVAQPRGVSDHWSGRNDSNFGLQANYLASESVEAVAQAVSRYNHKGNFDPELTELLVKYDPNAYLSVRGGRVGTDFFMHGDSRLIGYSQLTVRPNIDYFSSLAVTYLDGADATATLPLGEGLLRGKVYYGLLGEKLRFADGILDLRGSRSIGGYLDYQAGDWQWRGGIARIRFKHSLSQRVGELQAALAATGVPSAQRAADALELQGTEARFYSLGAVHDRGPLLLQFMLGWLRNESPVIQDQNSATFLAGYRVGDIKPFVGYSRVKSHSSHVSSGLPGSGGGAQINAGLADVLAQSHADQHTYSLGLRWDFRRDMAFKLQVDAIRGDPDSLYTFRRETPRWNGKTNVVTLALDFVF